MDMSRTQTQCVRRLVNPRADYHARLGKKRLTEVDQRRDGEEMPAVPSVDVTLGKELHVGLVDDRGGLQAVEPSDSRFIAPTRVCDKRRSPRLQVGSKRQVHKIAFLTYHPGAHPPTLTDLS